MSQPIHSGCFREKDVRKWRHKDTVLFAGLAEGVNGPENLWVSPLGAVLKAANKDSFWEVTVLPVSQWESSGTYREALSSEGQNLNLTFSLVHLLFHACFSSLHSHHFSHWRCIWSLEVYDACQWWQILYYDDYHDRRSNLMLNQISGLPWI